MSETHPTSGSISLCPIGVIHSPHVRAEETPIQPSFAEGVPGQAEILPEYAGGLADLDGFSHVWLLYWFHRAGPARLIVKPFLQDAGTWY